MIPPSNSTSTVPNLNKQLLDRVHPFSTQPLHLWNSFCAPSSVNMNILTLNLTFISETEILHHCICVVSSLNCCPSNGAGAGARRTRPSFPRRKGGRSSSCACPKAKRNRQVMVKTFRGLCLLIQSTMQTCAETITSVASLGVARTQHSIPTRLWRSFCDLRSSVNLVKLRHTCDRFN